MEWNPHHISEYARQSRPLGRGTLLREGKYIEPRGEKRDLGHGLMVEHNGSADYVPIHTNNMRASGLLHGGLAIVNTESRPKLGHVLAVRYNGIVIIRRLEKRNGQLCFVSDDPREELLYIEGAEVERIGIVTWSLFKV